MKIAKWGNSLAIRLPRAVTESLDLKEGDDVDLRRAPEGHLEVLRNHGREEALAQMEALSRPLPSDYKFDRNEIYDRLGADSPGRRRG